MKVSTSLAFSAFALTVTGFNAYIPRAGWAPSARRFDTQLGTFAEEWTNDASVKIRKSERKLTATRTDPKEYWFDSRIHTLGNTGVFGALHAAMAAVSTKVIDLVAYEGIDVRKQVAMELHALLNRDNARVLDMCSGVGTSTRALARTFVDAETVIGVDTSPEMTAMASFLSRHLFVITTINEILSKANPQSFGLPPHFVCGNAEDTKLSEHSFDLVTVMYGLHEIPKEGRAKILSEARRLLRPGGLVAVVDIAADYTPSASMLAGEPYVLEYQKNIRRQLAEFEGFTAMEFRTVVPGHVGMWILKTV